MRAIPDQRKRGQRGDGHHPRIAHRERAEVHHPRLDERPPDANGGAGHQIRKLAEQIGVTPSNVDGTGITDEFTLHLALTAANRVTHEILEGLSATDLRGATTLSGEVTEEREEGEERVEGFLSRLGPEQAKKAKQTEKAKQALVHLHVSIDVRWSEGRRSGS